MTQLGQKLSIGANGKPAAPSSLARWQSTNQRGMDVTLPLLGPVWIELAGDAVVTQIEGAVFREMEAHGLQPVPINSLSYDAARTRRTLAWAIREIGDHAKPFGSLEEWSALDTDLLSSIGVFYNTAREQLDPFGMATLTKQDADEIRLAIEKKNPNLLRSYGIAKLSLYLLSMESPPATSPTPMSSSGPLSSES